MKVFDSDPLSQEVHPLNKKAKCKVYLRDLQREFGLSDAALQYIALICGPRWVIIPAGAVLGGKYCRWGCIMSHYMDHAVNLH